MGCEDSPISVREIECELLDFSDGGHV
jgi:hypothetical protein